MSDRTTLTEDEYRALDHDPDGALHQCSETEPHGPHAHPGRITRLKRFSGSLTVPLKCVGILTPPVAPPDVMRPPRPYRGLEEHRGTYAYGYRVGLRAIPDGRSGPHTYDPATHRERRGCQDALAERGIELRPRSTRWLDPWRPGSWVFRTVGSPKQLPPR